MTTIYAEAEDVIERNLVLAFDLMQAAIADPSILDQFPDGATVVIVPDTDEKMASVNLELGKQAAGAGQNVYFYHQRAESREKEQVTEAAAGTQTRNWY